MAIRGVRSGAGCELACLGMGLRMSYAAMKVLETAPARYDRGMRILTLGRLDHVYREIEWRLRAGDRVLDVGCGTGTLAILLARRGVDVTGIDISSSMLRVARQRVAEQGQQQIALRQMGIVDLDTAFADGRFDAVVGTLVLSELSDDEITYGLKECRRILHPDGKLFIADEILPESLPGRLVTALVRLPFVLLALLLTQNTSHRIGRLRQRIEAAGFRVVASKRYLARTLELLVAERLV